MFYLVIVIVLVANTKGVYFRKGVYLRELSFFSLLFKKVSINRFQKTKEKIYSSTQYPV